MNSKNKKVKWKSETGARDRGKTSGSIYFLDIFYLFGVNHIAMIYLVIGVIGLFISIIDIYRRSR